MTTMLETITGGVDTHLDVHVAAALNAVGGYNASVDSSSRKVRSLVAPASHTSR